MNDKAPADGEECAATDVQWMDRALALARQGAATGEVPVGAILVLHGRQIAVGWNCPISTRDPTAHAEIQALRAAAGGLDNYRLPDATLYVTLEPCVMCVGALVHARVKRLVYAAPEPRTGAVASRFQLLEAGLHNHDIQVTAGIRADASAELLRSFFRQRRG